MTTLNFDGSESQASDARIAHLYRMKTDSHICPFGLKSLHILKSAGYQVEDHPLTSRAETDAFQKEHDVSTTPQTFINGERIGGYEDTRRFLGLSVQDKDKKSYAPVIAIFGLAFAMAVAVSLFFPADLLSVTTVERFVAFGMCLLALQKLRDVSAFANGFLGYDLLAQRYVPYAFIYPFLEAGAGVLMLAGLFIWLAAPVALFIGTIGAISVIKAVYVDKRELKCACVGGDSNVPLGFISLTENLMMMGMGLWMLVRMVV